MENKRQISKIKQISSRKKVFLRVGIFAVAIAAVIAAVVIDANNHNKPEPLEPLEKDPITEGLSDTGNRFAEYTLPEDFDELDNFEPDPKTGEIDPETGEEVTVTNKNTPSTPRPPATPIVSGLPKVYINVDSGKTITSRTSYTGGTFSISAPDSSGFHSFETMRVNVRGRGNSTWKAPKKPYRLKFDEKVSFLGLPKGSNYVLLANSYDPSHIRNSVAFATARVLSFNFVPSAVHVDLYLNGKYQGLYTIGDNVRHTSNGIGIKSGEGFLLELGGSKNDLHKEGRDFFRSSIQRNVRIRYPSPGAGGDLTAAQFNEIQRDFTAACDSILLLRNYEDHVDILSLVDFFLHTELLYNFDGSFARSVFIMKNPGEKLKMASVWDYDLGIGNYTADRGRYTSWACVHNSSTYHSQPTWINYLIEDPVFQYAVRKRWEQVGDRMYNAALAEVSKNRTLLPDAVRRNNQVAPFRTNVYTSRRTAEISSFGGQLDYIQTFLRLRRNWMNTEIAKYPSSPPNGKDILNLPKPPVTTTPPVTEVTTYASGTLPPIDPNNTETVTTTVTTVTTVTTTTTPPGTEATEPPVSESVPVVSDTQVTEPDIIEETND